MANQIIWSPKAILHLESICDYIAEDSPNYAAIFAKRVLDVVKVLADFPYSGQIVPEYKDKKIA